MIQDFMKEIYNTLILHNTTRCSFNSFLTQPNKTWNASTRFTTKVHTLHKVTLTCSLVYGEIRVICPQCAVVFTWSGLVSGHDTLFDYMTF